jgi:hypothetical protein
MGMASKPVLQGLVIMVSTSGSLAEEHFLTSTGRPMEIVTLGKTFLPKDVIWEYLESLKEIYAAEVDEPYSNRVPRF